MILRNREGRITDVPYRMEERGFKQASEVLSISKELMEGSEPLAGMSFTDMKRLRTSILHQYPNVVTDEEYIAKNGYIYDIPGEDKKELVNEDMTKKEIIKKAEDNGMKLESSEKRLVKAELIELINERH
jgi:hypothetical protein